ncbi:MAG: TIGR01906 family membrane protein [Lachnospiraceae bacterium]|nr:TIGR01906 family membrane protein [Lachnospiraceae bacterium]
MISLLAVGLYIAVNFRALYYLNISWNDLPASSGYNAVIIRENYDALIDYCCPFFSGALSFPSIPSSASAISHFAEVKTIFNIIYISGAVGLIVTIATFVHRHREGSFLYLRTCAICAAVLPVFVSIFSLISFDTLFVLFHKLMFDNEDWLFNPATDPIITMLPESFFAQCAILIAVVMLIGAGTTYFFYRRRFKIFRESQSLTPPKKNYIY